MIMNDDEGCGVTRSVLKIGTIGSRICAFLEKSLEDDGGIDWRLTVGKEGRWIVSSG